MMKKFIYISIIGLFLIGCKSIEKSNNENYLAYLNDSNNLLPNDYLEKLKKSSDIISMDSIRANTSDFYDIEIYSKPNKKTFTLEEQKEISIEIINYGNKILYLPEWFRTDKVHMNNSIVEMNIEIYRKEKLKFVPYVQKRMKTEIFQHPTINPQKRIVYESNRGKHIHYNNIWIDM